jgi:hypothetical protein
VGLWGGSKINCEAPPPHIQPGHPRVASPSRHPLAALAVGGQRALLSARYGPGGVLACVRSAGGVSSSVALVAALRVQLPQHHRLVAAVTPPAVLSSLSSTLP